MLKIKSNTNEFTIIFSEKIGKKKECSKDLVQPLFSSAPLLLFSFFSSFLFVSAFFLFPGSVFSAYFCFCLALLFVSFLPAFLFFLVHVCPFFSPKTFFSAQNTFVSAQNLFQFSPKPFFSFSASSFSFL